MQPIQIQSIQDQRSRRLSLHRVQHRPANFVPAQRIRPKDGEEDDASSTSTWTNGLRKTPGGLPQLPGDSKPHPPQPTSISRVS